MLSVCRPTKDIFQCSMYFFPPRENQIYQNPMTLPGLRELYNKPIGAKINPQPNTGRPLLFIILKVDIILIHQLGIYLLLDQGRQFSQCYQLDRRLGNDISVLQQVLCQGPYRQHLKTSLSSLCTRLAALSVKKQGIGMGESSKFLKS